MAPHFLLSKSDGVWVENTQKLFHQRTTKMSVAALIKNIKYKQNQDERTNDILSLTPSGVQTPTKNLLPNNYTTQIDPVFIKLVKFWDKPTKKFDQQ